MFKFIRESLRELEHVVWPTPKETRKYMGYNVWTIIALTIFLSILGTLLSMSLSGARGLFDHESVSTSVNTGNETVNEEDLNKLLEDFSVTTTVSGEATDAVQATLLTGSTENKTPLQEAASGSQVPALSDSGATATGTAQ